MSVHECNEMFEVSNADCRCDAPLARRIRRSFSLCRLRNAYGMGRRNFSDGRRMCRHSCRRELRFPTDGNSFLNLRAGFATILVNGTLFIFWKQNLIRFDDSRRIGALRLRRRYFLHQHRYHRHQTHWRDLHPKPFAEKT